MLIFIKDNVIKNKSFDFTLRIVKFYQYLVTDKKEYVLSKKLLISDTVIGAMARESKYGNSKAD